jgi:hypothetical protein
MKTFKLPFWIYVNYEIDGKIKQAHIRTTDFSGTQDAQIGDFSENWFIRPYKATHKQEYKTLKAYKTACTLSLKKKFKDIKLLGYYEKIDVDGVEYEKAI